MNSVWQILVQAKLLNTTEKTEERIHNFCDFYTIYGISSIMERVSHNGSDNDDNG